MKYFILILLILFFIPLPIKITFLISNNDLVLKIYNFNILDKLKNKKNHKTPVVNERNDTEKAHQPHLKKEKRFKNLSIHSILQVVNIVNDNKFKPSLKFKGSFEYSLNDAAKTAIFYGLLSTYSPLVLWILEIIFKIREFNLPIKPVFNDKISGRLEINSIITISLAQITYMSILFLRGLKILKGGEKLERVKL
ncbi:MAG: DUF2953 domain-containing protein [Clostridiaceae bacterium]|nr:DUF2953 domain-containing protein [Clostridiaceae bacterium]